MGAWGTPIIGAQQLPWNRNATFGGEIELTALSDDHEGEIVHFLSVFEHAAQPEYKDAGTLIQVCLGVEQIRTLRGWCDEVLAATPDAGGEQR